MSSSLYTNIEDPTELRKGTLGLSKDVIKTLQSFEILKEIRSEKARQIIVLKNIIDEIKVLDDTMKEKLPADEFKPENTLKKEKKIAEVVVKKKKTALDKLEEELSDIESRISNIP